MIESLTLWDFALAMSHSAPLIRPSQLAVPFATLWERRVAATGGGREGWVNRFE